MTRYLYGRRLRGFSLGCQPMNGLTARRNASGERYYDILVYRRKLTDEECESYELDFLGEEEAEE